MQENSQHNSDGTDEGTARLAGVGFSRDRALAVALAALLLVNAASASVAALPVSDASERARTADAAVDDPKCDDDRLTVDENGSRKVLEGYVTARDGSKKCAGTQVTIPKGLDKVRITLSSQSDADLDLFVTLDGRPASRTSNDEMAAYTDDSTPSIVLGPDEIPADRTIGVAVASLSGGGNFEVDISAAKKGVDARIRIHNDSPRVGQNVLIDGTDTYVANGTAKVMWLVDGEEISERGWKFEHEFEKAGTHTVSLRVQGSGGSMDVARKKIKVRASKKKRKVVARLDVLSDDSIWTNETIRFSGERSHGEAGIDRYLWRFSDGTKTTGPTVEHTFTEPGTYTVALTVVDEGVGKHTVKKEITVRRPEVWVKSVEGGTTRVLPDELFARCPDPVMVTVAGSESVDKVKFSVGGRTVTDDFGSDGWRVKKRQLLRGAGRSDVLRITAVGADGSVDTETVRIRTAKAPGSLRLITNGINSIVRGATGLMNKSIFNLGKPPLIATRCKIALNYPQIANSITGLQNVTGMNISLPDKITRFFPNVMPFTFYGQFKMQYLPLQDQIGIGGGVGLGLNINPTGESNVRGGGDVTGYFAMPKWNLKRFQAHAYLEANVYLEEYVSPVPIPSWNVKIPYTNISLNIDPVDVRVTPRLDVIGGIDSDFDLSSMAVGAKGSIAIHGQLGGKCFANVVGLGCVGLRAWVNGSLESNYIGIVPGKAKTFSAGGLSGKATVGGGFQAITPTGLIPDYKVAWRKQFVVSTARLAPSGGPATGRSYATDTGKRAVVTKEINRGHGQKVTASPAAALRDDTERASVPGNTLAAA